jgi:hypothetical protein
MSYIEESERLHARVRDFARAEGSNESFAALALDIAEFQSAHSAAHRRLHSRRHATHDPRHLPAVPTEAYRFLRVALHPPEADVARFRTSGTTAEIPGVHAFRTLATYRELCLVQGERALCSAGRGPHTVVALASVPEAPPSSSLAYMMERFMEAFDRNVLEQGAELRAESRWLLRDGCIDVQSLRGAARRALEREEPLLVLATSFALVYLLDILDGGHIEAPAETVVMQTGGFKGRSREIEPNDLRAAVARAFGIREAQVIGEYGMTELTSQLYEGTLPGGTLSGPKGVYLEPPWLLTVPVDPLTLEPVAAGEPGLAKFVDLGNVDSSIAVLTSDVVRRTPSGIELLGRSRGAAARGCSLAVEEFLGAGSRAR